MRRETRGRGESGEKGRGRRLAFGVSRSSRDFCIRSGRAARGRRSPQSPCAMESVCVIIHRGTEGRGGGFLEGEGGGVAGAGDAPRRAPVPVVDRVVRRERSGIVRRAGVVAVMDRDQKLLATAEVQGEMLESLRARRRGLRATRRDVSDGGRCRGGTRARERPAAGRGDEGHARRAHLQTPKLQGILVKVIHRARLEGAPPGSARANAAGWHSQVTDGVRVRTTPAEHRCWQASNRAAGIGAKGPTTKYNNPDSDCCPYKRTNHAWIRSLARTAG